MSLSARPLHWQKLPNDECYQKEGDATINARHRDGAELGHGGPGGESTHSGEMRYRKGQKAKTAPRGKCQ